MSSLLLLGTKIEDIKMVIFDKDGTLIDIHHYWCSMIEFRAQFFIDSLDIKEKQKLYNELVHNMGIDLETKKMKSEGPVGIKPRAFIVEVALKTIQKYDHLYTKEMVESVFADVDEYSKSKLENIVNILPDVEKILKDLKNANISSVVATTDLTSRAILAMKSLQLEEYFLDIVGADLVTHAKPSSDLVDYILQKFSLSNKDVIVIGDSMADLGMAKNANCKFLGLKSGLYNDEFVNTSKYIIDDFRELKVER